MKKLAFVAALLCATAASASDRRVRVVNHSGCTVVRILGSNVGESRWRYDFLGDDVIPPHASRTIDVDDGEGWCRFDLKAETSCGSDATRANINVCEVETWHLYD